MEVEQASEDISEKSSAFEEAVKILIILSVFQPLMDGLSAILELLCED